MVPWIQIKAISNKAVTRARHKLADSPPSLVGTSRARVLVVGLSLGDADHHCPLQVSGITSLADAFGHPVVARTVDGTNGRPDLSTTGKVIMSSKPSNSMPNAAQPTSKTFDVELNHAELDAVSGGFVPGALATKPILHQVTGSDASSYLD